MTGPRWPSRSEARPAGSEAGLERGDCGEQPAEPSVQDRADADPQRNPVTGVRGRGVADGVDDRGGGQQPGDDREADRGAHAKPGHQAEREQWADGRTEVIHHPLEPVGAAVGRGRDDIG